MLALEERVVTHNVRISVVHEDMRTWRLRIKQLRESDRGCYMCQINASPMRKQIGCIDVQGECHFVQFPIFHKATPLSKHEEDCNRKASTTCCEMNKQNKAELETRPDKS